MTKTVLLNLNDEANGRYIYEIYRQIMLPNHLACLYSNNDAKDCYTIDLDCELVALVLSEDLFLFIKDNESQTPYLMTARFSQGISGSFGSVSVVGGSWKIDLTKKIATYHQKEELKRRVVKVGNVYSIDSYMRENQRALKYMGFKYPPFEKGLQVFNLMRLLPGENVVELIDKKGSIKDYQFFGETLKTTMLMLKALKEVHDQNVIHGDVKPDNMMFDGRRVWLIDFGFSKKVKKSNTYNKPWRFGAPLYRDPRLLDESLSRADKTTDLYSMIASIAELLGDSSRQLLKRSENISNNDIFEMDKNYPFKGFLSQMPEMYHPIKNELSCIVKKGLDISVDNRSNLDKTIKDFEAILKKAYKLRKKVVRNIINKVQNNDSLVGLSKEEAYVFLNSRWVNNCLSKNEYIDEISQVVDILGHKIVSLSPRRRKQLKECGIKPKPETLDVMITDEFPLSEIKMLIDCGIEVTPEYINHFFKDKLFSFRHLEIALLLRNDCTEFKKVVPSIQFSNHFNLLLTHFWQNPNQFTPQGIYNLIDRHFKISNKQPEIKKFLEILPKKGSGDWGYMYPHFFKFIDLRYSIDQPLPDEQERSALMYFFELRNILCALSELPVQYDKRLQPAKSARNQVRNNIIKQINDIIAEPDYECWKSRLVKLINDKNRHQRFFSADKNVFKSLCIKTSVEYVLKIDLVEKDFQDAAQAYNACISKSNPHGFFDKADLSQKPSKQPVNKLNGSLS